MTLQYLETVLRSQNWATVDDKELKLVRDPHLSQRKRLQLLAYLEDHPLVVGEEIRKEININMLVSMSLNFFIIQYAIN